MNENTYPVVCFGGPSKSHAAWSIDPRDSLYETFCGIHLRSFDYTDLGPEEVTCKRCRRSLGSRADSNRVARATLAIGQ